MNAYETHENTARRYGWTVVRSGVIGYQRGDVTVSVQYSANGNVVSATRAVAHQATDAVFPRYGAKKETVNGWLATSVRPTVTLTKTPVRTDELGPTGENIAEIAIVLSDIAENHDIYWWAVSDLRRNDLKSLQRWFADTIERPEVTAGRNLGAFMIELQAATVTATGVYPVATSAAPQTYAELLQCGARWQYELGDVQLPVWNGASDTSIYGSDTANHAFRYWHDMGHIAHHCSFTPEDEIRLQMDHHWPIIAERFGLLSLESRLYYADTIGQIEYVRANGRFPVNQAQFASAYLRNSRLAINTAY